MSGLCTRGGVARRFKFETEASPSLIFSYRLSHLSLVGSSFTKKQYYIFNIEMFTYLHPRKLIIIPLLPYL